MDYPTIDHFRCRIIREQILGDFLRITAMILTSATSWKVSVCQTFLLQFDLIFFYTWILFFSKSESQHQGSLIFVLCLSSAEFYWSLIYVMVKIDHRRKVVTVSILLLMSYSLIEFKLQKLLQLCSQNLMIHRIMQKSHEFKW